MAKIKLLSLFIIFMVSISFVSASNSGYFKAKSNYKENLIQWGEIQEEFNKLRADKKDEELFQKTKDYLISSADLVIEHLKFLKEKNPIQVSVQTIDYQINEIKEIKVEINNAVKKKPIQLAAKNLRISIQDANYLTKKVGYHLLIHRVANLLNDYQKIIGDFNIILDQKSSDTIIKEKKIEMEKQYRLALSYYEKAHHDYSSIKSLSNKNEAMKSILSNLKKCRQEMDILDIKIKELQGVTK